MKETTLLDIFDGPEGQAYLTAISDLLEGPRAPTKSGYWFGLLTGKDKVDPAYVGKSWRDVREEEGQCGKS